MKTALTREQLLERVGQMAAEQVGADAAGVTAETDLFADLNYDSLDAVELTMNLEEEFEINIPDEAAEGAKTIGQIVELLMVG